MRWLGNLTIWLIDGMVVRALFPLLGIGAAVLAAERGLGLLKVVPVPPVAGFLVSVLALDLAKYAEHRAFHRVPVLWRVHRMHHADVDFDFTLGFRFHPIEALLSTGWTFGMVVVVGAPPAAVALWHILLIVSGPFGHGNVRMPRAVDGLLRLIMVTPDMHRVHHSAVLHESGSNLGSIFPWWDRLFGTYVAAPSAGLDAMRIGLDDFRERKHLTLPWMLAHPFLGATVDVSSEGAARAQLRS